MLVSSRTAHHRDRLPLYEQVLLTAFILKSEALSYELQVTFCMLIGRYLSNKEPLFDDGILFQFPELLKLENEIQHVRLAAKVK